MEAGSRDAENHSHVDYPVPCLQANSWSQSRAMQKRKGLEKESERNAAMKKETGLGAGLVVTLPKAGITITCY